MYYRQYYCDLVQGIRNIDQDKVFVKDAEYSFQKLLHLSVIGDLLHLNSEGYFMNHELLHLCKLTFLVGPLRNIWSALNESVLGAVKDAAPDGGPNVPKTIQNQTLLKRNLTMLKVYNHKNAFGLHPGCEAMYHPNCGDRFIFLQSEKVKEAARRKLFIDKQCTTPGKIQYSDQLSFVDRSHASCKVSTPIFSNDNIDSLFWVVWTEIYLVIIAKEREGKQSPEEAIAKDCLFRVGCLVKYFRLIAERDEIFTSVSSTMINFHLLQHNCASLPAVLLYCKSYLEYSPLNVSFFQELRQWLLASNSRITSAAKQPSGSGLFALKKLGEWIRPYITGPDDVAADLLQNDLKNVYYKFFLPLKTGKINIYTHGCCNGIDIRCHPPTHNQGTIDAGDYLRSSWDNAEYVETWGFVDITCVEPNLKPVKIETIDLFSYKSKLYFGINSEERCCQFQGLIYLSDLMSDTVLNENILKQNVICVVLPFEHDNHDICSYVKVVDVEMHRGLELKQQYVFANRVIGVGGFLPCDKEDKIVESSNKIGTRHGLGGKEYVNEDKLSIVKLLMVEPMYNRINNSRDVLKEKITIVENE
jgi:hypothetical protein